MSYQSFLSDVCSLTSDKLINYPFLKKTSSNVLDTTHVTEPQVEISTRNQKTIAADRDTGGLAQRSCDFRSGSYISCIQQGPKNYGVGETADCIVYTGEGLVITSCTPDKVRKVYVMYIRQCRVII